MTDLSPQITEAYANAKPVPERTRHLFRINFARRRMRLNLTREDLRNQWQEGFSETIKKIPAVQAEMKRLKRLLPTHRDVQNASTRLRAAKSIAALHEEWLGLSQGLKRHPDVMEAKERGKARLS